MSQAYVLLDRDGVINIDSDDYIKSPEEWSPIPNSLAAIALLNKNGFNVAVISNQSGLNRGLYTHATLENIHKKMHRLTHEQGGEISHVYYCPHIADDKCTCRKPKPGLLLAFSKQTNTCLANTFFIGDKLSDIQAAQAAGAKPLLVKTGKGQKTIQNNPHLNLPIFEHLYDAATFIISNK